MPDQPIIDAFPFPFGNPMAQELVRVMAGLYRTQLEAAVLVEPLGISFLELTPNLSPINMWWEVLPKLAVQGTVRQAVQAARTQFPNNPRAAFLDALLHDRGAPSSAEPISQDGPAFDDKVTTPEALLFFDDLTMPTGKVASLIATLTKMLELAPAVCLLRVENEVGEFFGTGFRISQDRVLTNHHVLFPRLKPAARVQADFGFEADAQGATRQVTSIKCDAASVTGEMPDDWAIVTVPGMSDERPILSLEDAPAPRAGDLAYILQHPSAQQKRLGYVRNMISEVDDRAVRYLTDTEPGSSGAPVFDMEGRVVALHHAGGRPVEAAGKPPVSKNEGIRISRVFERMKAVGLI